MRALNRATAVLSSGASGCRPARAAGLVLIGSVVLSGCSLGGDETRPATGATAEIGRVVEALEQAAERGDFRRICDELLSAQARREAGGGECPSLLRSATGDLGDPTIEPQSVELRRGRASVRVEAGSRGHEPVDDTLELVREGGRWRISALAE